MSYAVVKTYGNDLGFSCCFRQEKASPDHCSLLHGYALGFKITFTSDTLDHRNWVISFGELKDVKAFLKETFDHTLAVSKSDTKLGKILELENLGLAKVVIFPKVGCEAFAEYAYDHINTVILPKYNDKYKTNVRLDSVEVFEHGSNSAIFLGRK